jgi:hypothetical protein
LPSTSSGSGQHAYAGGEFEEAAWEAEAEDLAESQQWWQHPESQWTWTKRGSGSNAKRAVWMQNKLARQQADREKWEAKHWKGKGSAWEGKGSAAWTGGWEAWAEVAWPVEEEGEAAVHEEAEEVAPAAEEATPVPEGEAAVPEELGPLDLLVNPDLSSSSSSEKWGPWSSHMMQ